MMHGPMIDAIRAQYQRLYIDPPPPAHKLVWLPWVGPWLRTLSPRPAWCPAVNHPASQVGHARPALGCAGEEA